MAIMLLLLGHTLLVSPEDEYDDCQLYSAGGIDSAVAVRSGELGDKLLEIQYINKSLPVPDEYPVRMFVNISYSFMDCPDGRECDDALN